MYQLLKTSTPAPHTKNSETIHEFIVGTYQKLLVADPAIARRPLGERCGSCAAELRLRG